jgi:hypothetical protein
MFIERKAMAPNITPHLRRPSAKGLNKAMTLPIVAKKRPHARLFLLLG